MNAVPSKAMVFAAGLGTRLKPLTDTMPKAMVPVAGQPLLHHVVSKIHSAGISDFVINTHHFASQIKDYVAGSPFGDGVRVAISDEQPELLETGGGILKAEPWLAGCGQFLVHNVDILSNLRIEEFSLEDGALATLLVSDRKTSRYFLFDDSMTLVGWTNISTGQVRSPYKNIDPSKCRRLAFAGVHILSDKVFDAMREAGFSGKFSIVDFYLAVCSIYKIKGFVQPDLKIMDVGKTETLAEAARFVTEL